MVDPNKWAATPPVSPRGATSGYNRKMFPNKKAVKEALKEIGYRRKPKYKKSWFFGLRVKKGKEKLRKKIYQFLDDFWSVSYINMEYMWGNPKRNEYSKDYGKWNDPSFLRALERAVTWSRSMSRKDPKREWRKAVSRARRAEKF